MTVRNGRTESTPNIAYRFNFESRQHLPAVQSENNFS